MLGLGMTIRQGDQTGQKHTATYVRPFSAGGKGARGLDGATATTDDVFFGPVGESGPRATYGIRHTAYGIRHSARPRAFRALRRFRHAATQPRSHATTQRQRAQCTECPRSSSPETTLGEGQQAYPEQGPGPLGPGARAEPCTLCAVHSVASAETCATLRSCRSATSIKHPPPTCPRARGHGSGLSGSSESSGSV